MSNEVSFEEISKRGYRGRLINWEMWLDGKGHVLERGKHFQGDRADSTRSAGRQWCDRHGLDVRTVIINPGDGDSLLALADDIDALAQDAPSDPDDLSDALLGFADRARKFNPKFWFEVYGGLSDEQIEQAKRLQELAGDDASDEKFAHLLQEWRRADREARRLERPEPVEKPAFDPLKERSDRLSDRLPREVVAEARPMGRKRRV